MVTPYKHKRSPNPGAIPQTLLDGELALRYAAGDPALLFKDSNGAITHVLAKIDGGEITASSSNSSSSSIALPGAPTNLTATAGNAQVSLNWTAPTESGGLEITDYVVEYSIDSGSTWQAVSTPSSSSAAAISSSSSSAAAGNIIQTTSGLYAWYDASAENSVYSAQTGGSVVTSDGGLVYRLADLSGNSRHLKTYYDGPYVPSLAASAQNGKNAVLFNAPAGTAYLYTAQNRESGSFLVSNPLTIFAVWKPLDNESQVIDDLRYSWGDRELSTAVQVGLRGGAVQASAPGQAKWVGSNYSRSGNWLCARAVFNGSSSSLYVNGAYDAPGGYSEPTQTPGDINMTHPCGDWRMNGYFQFGELAFYTGALSSGTCAAIESYLMAKWGIS